MMENIQQSEMREMFLLFLRKYEKLSTGEKEIIIDYFRHLKNPVYIGPNDESDICRICNNEIKEGEQKIYQIVDPNDKGRAYVTMCEDCSKTTLEEYRK